MIMRRGVDLGETLAVFRLESSEKMFLAGNRPDVVQGRLGDAIMPAMKVAPRSVSTPMEARVPVGQSSRFLTLGADTSA